jgi:spermidine synthase
VPARPRLAVALVGCAFFLSGVSALSFETLWFHQAGLAFGNSVWAASLTLSGFMAGLALGSALAARFGDRALRPLRAYASIECVLAASGVALVFVLPRLGAAFSGVAASLAEAPLALNALRLCTAFALLALPATAMGATLPLLTRALGGGEGAFGRTFGALYGVNTLGAVMGTYLAESYWLEAFGIRGSAWVAGALDVCAAALALLAARGVASEVNAAPAPPTAPAPDARDAVWLAAAFVCGFALLALEVVWLRVLLLFINDTPLAFALILAEVLFAIAVGGLIAAAWSSVSPRASDYAAPVAYAAGLLGFGGYLVYPACLARFWVPDQTAGSVLLVAAPLVLPASLLSGVLFTLLGAGLRRGGTRDAYAAGRLALWNTAGAALGSLCAGFVLLPRLGMERSLFALFVLYGGAGVLLMWRSVLSSRTRYASSAAFAFALAFFPFGSMQAKYVRASAGRWMRPGDRIVQVREGLTGTLVHVAHGAGGLRLFDQLATNAYSMSVNDFAGRRYMKLFVELPRALQPALRSALVVGYGIGNTVEALVATRETQRVDVVDLSRDVLELGRTIVPVSGKSPLADARVHAHVEDGRYFLETTSRRFDLITGEPPPPVMAGVVNLYTREYFELVRSRLNDGGIASYWLPMMNISAHTALSIVRGFCDAFDDCTLWQGSARNFMLMGTRSAADRTPVDRATFERAWRDPSVRAELEAIGFELPTQLGALFIGDAAFLNGLTSGVPPLTDDWPKRMHQRGTREERDALIWRWRDTKEARARFVASRWVAKFWPPDLLRDSLRQFENQRVVNDLMFPEQTPVRQTRVLHTLLRSTTLRLPVLLMLNSDPDVQRALAHAAPNVREQDAWLVHRAAGLLAGRDYEAALALLRRADPHALPLPDLREYLEFAVQHDRAQAAAPAQ